MRYLLAALPYLGRALWWLLKQPFLLAGWVLSELFGQAKTGVKKALRPLLWPIVGLAIFGFLFATMDPRAFEALLQLVLTVAVLVGFVWFLGRMVFPKKKKKS